MKALSGGVSDWARESEGRQGLKVGSCCGGLREVLVAGSAKEEVGDDVAQSSHVFEVRERALRRTKASGLCPGLSEMPRLHRHPARASSVENGGPAAEEHAQPCSVESGYLDGFLTVFLRLADDPR